MRRRKEPSHPHTPRQAFRFAIAIDRMPRALTPREVDEVVAEAQGQLARLLRDLITEVQRPDRITPLVPGAVLIQAAVEFRNDHTRPILKRR